MINPTTQAARRLALLQAASLIAATLVFAPGAATAQTLNEKAVRLVVPYPPGGTIDGLTRIVGEKLQRQFPAGLVIENRAGANGNIGAENVYRSAPDGTALMFTPSGPIAVNQALYPKLGYDPTKWVPVTLLAETPNVLVVHPSVPAKTLPEFIAYLKANPDKVSFASQGSGSSSHLAAVLFMQLTGTQMTHVPYKGTGPALNDLLGGQVEVFFDNLSSAGKFHANGRLRVIAVADTKRSAKLPEIPTFAEAGPPAMKDMISTAWYGVVAPPGTPAATIAAYQKAITDVIALPDVKKKFEDLGVDPDVASPEQTAAFIRDETQKWGKVIRDAKLSAD
ncbi:tripartite tricarboxylate transporter substrate binding protein [soil metagenome]